jgi:acyl-CoA synthetase (AMP-forming)/AMP-acid ligase II
MFRLSFIVSMSVHSTSSSFEPDIPKRLVLGNLAAWTHLSSVVYASPIYSPPAIVDALTTDTFDERPTAIHGVPTHHLGVLTEAEKRGLNLKGTGLRTGIASGSPVPMELMKRLQNTLGLDELTIAYGMST